jgi:conjugative transfer signal peptidase TraF
MNTQQKVPFLRHAGYWAGGISCVLFGMAWGSGLRLVVSPSVPIGIYRATQEPIVRGAYVAVCLPADIAAFAKERQYLSFGFCDGWVQPVIKVVGAVAGDRVIVQETGVSVNGEALLNSETLAQDSAGRPLTHVTWRIHYVLDGEVWLFSFHDPRSWDSRYYGPVSTTQIVSTARAVWVKK